MSTNSSTNSDEFEGKEKRAESIAYDVLNAYFERYLKASTDEERQRIKNIAVDEAYGAGREINRSSANPGMTSKSILGSSLARQRKSSVPLIRQSVPPVMVSASC
jgi:hypothetical protein